MKSYIVYTKDVIRKFSTMAVSTNDARQQVAKHLKLSHVEAEELGVHLDEDFGREARASEAWYDSRQIDWC